MVPRRVLVVSTAPIEASALREEVRRHTGEDDAELKIVVPTANLSPLQWLTGEEDEARAEAAEVAEQSAGAVDSEAGGDVETQGGDPDPVQAIEDALATFPADEVIVVTRAGGDATWLEKDAGPEARRRFGVPVTHLTV